MGQCAQRLAETLPRLDDDPLAFPPREPYCGICGRELTDPISVGVGIGPECGLRYPWLFDRRPPEEPSRSRLGFERALMAETHRAIDLCVVIRAPPASSLYCSSATLMRSGGGSRAV